MRVLARVCPAAILVAVVAAGCGGSGAATTSTTVAPTSSAPLAATSTTRAATTSTRPADAHPVWPRRWAEVWPADGAEATYQVLTFDGQSLLVPARLDYGVAWEGGTWDRLTVGTADFGGTGAAFYFDRSEPWVIRWWGVESFFPGMPEGQVQREWFAEPAVLDLGGLPEAALELEGTINQALFRGTEPVNRLSFTAEGGVVGVEALEVPVGTLERTLHLRFTLGGEFASGEEITSDMWINAEWFLVKWEGTFGFQSIALASPWE